MVTILIIFILAPFQHANAEDRSFYISGYIINVNINEDGSADIEERITYQFSGKFNGALRDIDFSETNGMTEKRVYVEKDSQSVEYALNDTNSMDYNGQPGTYNYTTDGSIAHFKIFEPSSDEVKTFIIKYRFQDVVKCYNDIAEFNRKLIDENWKCALENIRINLTIPEGASPEEIKVFAHGPLTGESTIIDNRTMEFSVNSVYPGTFVETLVLFPPRLVPQSSNRVNENELPGIMANEVRLAEEANNQREEARRQVEQDRQAELQRIAEHSSKVARLSPIGNIITVLLIICWIMLIVYLYMKYDKELKHSFEGKYYRELPGEYTPAEMSVLMSFGSVETRDIMATLMDLVRKKQLLLNSGIHYKKGLFGTKEIQTYVISLKQDAPKLQLKKHEHFLIDWFIGKIGGGMSVNLEEIKAFGHKNSQAQQFLSDYQTFCRLAKEEADRNGFFDGTSNKGRLIGILSGLLYIGSGILISVALFAPIAAIFSVLGVILLIFGARLKRRTAYGNEQHAMWEAFRNFLKDFSRMDKAILPSIVIWEYYLVYAISLGVAKEVIKQLPLVFSDNDLNDVHLTYMYGGAYGYLSGFNTVFSDTINTVEDAISSAVSIANSTNSSSSGSGGGFSGGSSGGGGGGGGGGAF